jgi:uncharacterized protein
MTDRELDFLLNDFAARVPGVAHALAVSGDGLLIAASAALPRDQADRAAAGVAGLLSLLHGLGGAIDAGPLASTMAEYRGGFLIIEEAAAAGSRAALAVLAAAHCDMGQVAAALAELAHKVGAVLTPAARSPVADLPGAVR